MQLVFNPRSVLYKYPSTELKEATENRDQTYNAAFYAANKLKQTSNSNANKRRLMIEKLIIYSYDTIFLLNEH